MSEFKAGDKIECIDDRYMLHLKEGQIYTFVEYDRNHEIYISILTEDGKRYNHLFKKRFKLYNKNKEENMNNFKAGDKVKYKSDVLFTFRNINKNDTYEIYRVNEWIYIQDLNGKIITEEGFGQRFSDFELVEEKKQTPEELFEVFLKGQEAQNKLIESGLLEVNAGIKNSWINTRKTTKSFRLKPKKEFKEFYLKDTGHSVRKDIDSDFIIVGCQRIEFIPLQNDLRYIFRDNKSVTELLECTQRGLRYIPSGNYISFVDGRMLLDAMENYTNG